MPARKSFSPTWTTPSSAKPGQTSATSTTSTSNPDPPGKCHEHKACHDADSRLPFPYDEYLQHPSGPGSIPEAAHGTEVAVIGAEIAGVDSAPFPNPMDAASPSPVVELGGEQYYASTSGKLPPFFQEVADAWEHGLEERAEYAAMQQAITDRDYATIKRIWAGLVPVLDDTSFSNYLANSKAFSDLPYQYREAFGQIGSGSGGWDVSFPNAILEIFRVVYMECENNQRRILGGARGITDGLWNHGPENMVHWPKALPWPPSTAAPPAVPSPGFIEQQGGRNRP